jgi:hypothetical protein
VLAGLGCDDGGSDAPASPTDDSAAATRRAENAADRPEWFPASFPLAANTTVVSESAAEGGGGVAAFAAPVSAPRMLEILALNWEIHAWVAAEPEETADGTSISIENADFTGTVVVSEDGDQSLVNVELRPK